jgi:hypothetical protein
LGANWNHDQLKFSLFYIHVTLIQKPLLAVIMTLTLAVSCAPINAFSQAVTTTSPAAISLGTVKSISGNSITLTTDAGTQVSVTVQPDAKFVRTAPGHKDLQGAMPIQLSDVQIGDRMLARGKLADDGKTVFAVSVVVMKREDIAQKQELDQEDWRRGVSGEVKSLDPTAQTITISTGGLAARTVTVQASKATVIRRYSPDSIKFDDAKVGTFDQIKVNDQLRARGDRNSDGSQLTAREIVTGTFRNISGTVLSTDAANNTVTVSDLLSKKPVTVKVGTDSQLHKLPQMMAMGIAARLKGTTATAPGPNGAPTGPPAGSSAPSQSGAPQQRPFQGAAAGGSGGSGGAPRGDFQQMLSRMPAVTIADLQKGDAVILVTTEGSENSQPTAITLLTGVEPILTAAPDQAAMYLSPWSLSAPTGDAGP